MAMMRHAPIGRNDSEPSRDSLSSCYLRWRHNSEIRVQTAGSLKRTQLKSSHTHAVTHLEEGNCWIGQAVWAIDEADVFFLDSWSKELPEQTVLQFSVPRASFISVEKLHRAKHGKLENIAGKNY